MDREFIAERQKGLQAYLNYITHHHVLSSCELVKKFLDTNNYSANYTGKCFEDYFWFRMPKDVFDNRIFSTITIYLRLPKRMYTLM